MSPKAMCIVFGLVAIVLLLVVADMAAAEYCPDYTAGTVRCEDCCKRRGDEMDKRARGDCECLNYFQRFWLKYEADRAARKAN